MPRSHPVVAALAAVCLWATNALAATLALRELTVLQLLALQYATATAALLAWRALQTRRRTRSPGADHPPRATPRRLPGARATAVGVLGLTGTIFLQYTAFATAPVVAANVIAYGWPLMAALWAAATVRTRQTLTGVPLALLGFTGVVAIFAGDGPTNTIGLQLGYLLALASAACMAFYTIAAGRIDATAADLMLPATTVGTVIATIGIWLQGEPWPSPTDWLPALYIGLGPMAAGYGLWTLAMANRRADRLAPLGYATPLVSTVLLLATGQPFTTATLVGAALILIASLGVLANERRPADRPRTSVPSPPR